MNSAKAKKYRIRAVLFYANIHCLPVGCHKRLISLPEKLLFSEMMLNLSTGLREVPFVYTVLIWKKKENSNA